jgi:Fur family transcriptional regulator, ferric uptake regulator
MKNDQLFACKAVSYKVLLENFKILLKENSLKFTLQREQILKTLYDAHEHLSPELLHSKIQANMPSLNIGIATIYRTLALLEESDLVTSLPFGKQGKKYELADKEHHDHMICIKCGKILEFIDEEIEKRQRKIAKEHQFIMTSHSMQIFGICIECQRLNKEA